jgi:hypothetical protein
MTFTIAFLKYIYLDEVSKKYCLISNSQLDYRYLDSNSRNL